MGGRACVIIINAIVRFEEVPNAPGKRKELEAQLRACYATDTIAAAVAENEQLAMQVCETLEKHDLNDNDLKFLRATLPEYSEEPSAPS